MSQSITVILYAYLKTERFSKADIEMPEGAKVTDLLVRIGIDEADVGVLMINGRSGSLKQRIREKDKVTIIPPLGGG